MNKNLVLLDISFEDLKVSKLLFENNFYPQAIFYFQQSNEKMVKYLGINSQIINQNELHSKIGHKTLKIFKKSVELSLDRFQTNKNLDIKSDFQKIDEFIRNSDLREIIPFVINQIEESKNNSFELPFDLNSLSSPEYLIEFILKFSPENEELLNNIKKYSNDEIFKDLLNNGSNKFKTGLNKYLNSIFVLFFISSFLNYHVSTVRYPDQNMSNPSDLYGKNNPLVTSLPFFLLELEKCLVNLINFEKKDFF